MSIQQQSFGQTRRGEAVSLFTLKAGALQAQITNFGGALVALWAPDRAGQLADVVLGFETLAGYEACRHFFGFLVGRYANRIAGGRFLLDGQAVQLPCNDGPNHLHGGPGGFHTRFWQAEPEDSPDGPRLRLTYHSPHGEEGYPGNLTVQVTYTLSPEGALRLDYEATTDRLTVLNLTNHAYFNLAGAGRGDVLGHELWLNAGTFTPIDPHLIPTGELAPVAGSPFDFRQPTPIGARIAEPHPQLVHAGGYDHNFVLDSAGDLSQPAARVWEQASGRVLTVWTTQPGVQFYSGNFLSDTRGKAGQQYGKRGGFCLETQHFPDSPHQPHFPPVTLAPGQRYRHTTIYGFSTA